METLVDQGKHVSLSANSRFILNLIRVFASQMVVIGHGINFFEIGSNLKPPQMPYMQNIAVVTFFLISGFLISNSAYEKRQKENYLFKDFCFDRSVRIYTTLLPMLLIVVFLDLVIIYVFNDTFYQNAFKLDVFISNLFMLQDSISLSSNFSDFSLLGNTSFGSARPLWTIPVEWWMYFIFGFILLHNTEAEAEDQKESSKNLKEKIISFIIFLASVLFLAIIALGPRKRIKILLLTTWIIGYSFMLLINIRNKHRNYSFIRPILLFMIILSFLFFELTNIIIIIFLVLIEVVGFFLYIFHVNSKSRLGIILVQLEIKIKNILGNLIEKLSRKKKILFSFVLISIIGSTIRILVTKVAYDPLFILLFSISFYFIILFFNSCSFKIPETIIKIFQFLSSYSFVLYIVHYSIFIVFLNLVDYINISSTFLFFLAFIVINLISILLSLITERKTGIFKKKLKSLFD
ncbi:acyltransferase family protein [Candidatus Lokiarchaeum ossiferum]|uniref:acyltransferase family protein n=1 Tax=Candidatus Lokiarchaeum ossiferum TaxID=2951803 RepID=UPI00352E6E83